MKSEGLPAPLRVKKRPDFLRAQGRGDKHHARYFLVFMIARRRGGGSRTGEGPGPREALPTRLGITVTKKVGPAHVRNRIKRLVREAYRREKSRLRPGYDVVFVAKRNAGELSYGDAVVDVRRALGRLRLRGDAPGRASGPSTDDAAGCEASPGSVTLTGSMSERVDPELDDPPPASSRGPAPPGPDPKRGAQGAEAGESGTSGEVHGGVNR